MNYREASQQYWRTHGPNPTKEEIQLGAQLRMADAAEKMAENSIRLERDRDHWKWMAGWQLRDLNYAERRIAALKGVITKLKRKGKR